MSDYIEVDFLSVETDTSGDAIAVRYSLAGKTSIHIVDAGFKDSADHMIEVLKKHYGNPSHIDNIVITHGDRDHASGMRTILEHYPSVGALWMLRPWMYASELLLKTEFKSVGELAKHLRAQYSLIYEIEQIATQKGIQIFEPFQGASIGVFRVLSPSKPFYLDLILNSAKADLAEEDDRSIYKSGVFDSADVREETKYGMRPWGYEKFPEEDTPQENNTSVIQYSDFCEWKCLLTGDAGRAAFAHAKTHLDSMGVNLPCLNLFQIPHHGSRHNVSTQMLDEWLGPILPSKPDKTTFTAVVSSAKKDEAHPRKCVVRGVIHRGHFMRKRKDRIFAVLALMPQPGQGMSPLSQAHTPRTKRSRSCQEIEQKEGSAPSHFTASSSWAIGILTTSMHRPRRSSSCIKPPSPHRAGPLPQEPTPEI